MGTNYVNRVAIHPTAETSLPALAAAGSNIAQATWAGAGWTTLGAVRRGDAVDLDADTIEIPEINEVGVIRPPRSMAPEDSVNFAGGADEFEIPCYDVGQTLHELHSGAEVDGNEVENGGEIVYRAVAIEIAGIKVRYLPKCRLYIVNQNAGFAGDNPGKTLVGVVPHATTSIPAGIKEYYYE